MNQPLMADRFDLVHQFAVHFERVLAHRDARGEARGGLHELRRRPGVQAERVDDGHRDFLHDHSSPATQVRPSTAAASATPLARGPAMRSTSVNSPAPAAAAIHV